MKLYQRLYQITEIIHRAGPENSYYDKLCETQKKCIDMLPHESGFDGTWLVSVKKETLILTITFSFMDNNGYYDAYRDITVTIKPDFVFGFDAKITGIPRKHKDSYLDYIAETLDYSLSQEVLQ